MIRTSISLTKSQVNDLATLAKKDTAGAKVAQLIRRFIADGIERQKAAQLK